MPKLGQRKPDRKDAEIKAPMEQRFVDALERFAAKQKVTKTEAARQILVKALTPYLAVEA